MADEQHDKACPAAPTGRLFAKGLGKQIVALRRKGKEENY